MHSAIGVGLEVGATGWLHEAVAFAKPFRMPDFFLISGLFLGRIIDRPWREFADRRLLHFVYFYALWLFIDLALKSTHLGISAPEAFLRAYLWGFVEPFSSMWFIQLLPILFLAARLCERFSTSLTLAAAFALHVLAASRLHGGVYAMSSNLTGITTMDSFMLFSVYFVAGHRFSRRIFDFARNVAERPRFAIAGLLLWALLEEASVRIGLPEVPGLTLAFGFAGGLAVVAVSSLLARSDVLPPLAYCGRHSLVIYLSFFAPMAATRLALLSTRFVADVGLMSLIVAFAAIVAPLLLNAVVRGTTFGFLFQRPSWARLPAKEVPPIASGGALQ